MSTELTVEGNLVLNSNYDQLKNKLEIEIQNRYSIEATEDNLKECKQYMADINKDKAKLYNYWKERKKQLEAPIKEVDAQVKVLLNLFDDARAYIAQGVDFYESGKRELANKLANEYFLEKCLAKNVNVEDIEIPRWDNLTFVTSKNELSSMGKKAVDSFVSDLAYEQLKNKEAQARDELEKFKFKEALRQEILNETDEQKTLSTLLDTEFREEIEGDVEIVAVFEFDTEKTDEEITACIKQKLVDAGLYDALTHLKITRK